MWKLPSAEQVKQEAGRLHAAAMELRGRKLLALTLWLCVAGAIWLQPMAMRRRALEARLERVETRLAAEEDIHNRYSQYYDALQTDPTAIERAARALGYGRAGERLYPLTEKERRAARALAGRPADAPSSDWLASAGKTIGSALMILIVGVVAVLFFTGLKVEDHLDS